MTLRMKIDIVTAIKEKRTMIQRELFRTTFFEHLLDSEEPRFSVIFMHVVLLYMINSKEFEKCGLD